MLESMIDNPRPTRAEVSDVANAVYDGTDCVMLSAESAAGKYPVQSVAMMAKIIVESETQMALEQATMPQMPRHARGAKLSVAETICESMAHAAEDLDLSAIAIFTETGMSARLISMYRPNTRIFALSNDDSVMGKSVMLWGVHPIKVDSFGAGDMQVEMAEKTLRELGHVKPREVLGIVGGTASRIGGTNFMKLHEVRDPA
jgi:pyruvate kinase